MQESAMPKHEDYPEQAEADRQRAQDALEQAENAVSDAEEREEAILVEMDAAVDAAAEQAASQRHEAITLEIVGLKQDAERRSVLQQRPLFLGLQLKHT